MLAILEARRDILSVENEMLAAHNRALRECIARHSAAQRAQLPPSRSGHAPPHAVAGVLRSCEGGIQGNGLSTAMCALSMRVARAMVKCRAYRLWHRASM